MKLFACGCARVTYGAVLGKWEAVCDDHTVAMVRAIETRTFPEPNASHRRPT